jgi:hypothetical protein
MGAGRVSTPVMRADAVMMEALVFGRMMEAARSACGLK